MRSANRRLAAAIAALTILATWSGAAPAQHEGLLGEVHKLEARERAIDACIFSAIQW
jgi:hypothetical protein